MDRDQPTSDELIAEARANVTGRRRSLSESMAKAAHDQVIGDHELSYEMQQAGVPTGESLMADPADLEEIVASLAPERTRRPPAPAPRRQRTRLPLPTKDEETDLRPVEATNPFEVARSWRRRIPGLVALAVFAIWFVLGNLGGVIDGIGDFFDSGGDALPAVNEEDITNLTLMRGTNASGASEGQGPFFAVDGDTTSLWDSGGFAEQWIVIELDGPSTLTSARLLVGQSVEGLTVHEIVGWTPDSEEPFVIHEFVGDTQDGDWLEVSFDEPLTDVVAVAVVTFESPSQVTWREIEIYGVPSSNESA